MKTGGKWVCDRVGKEKYVPLSVIRILMAQPPFFFGEITSKVRSLDQANEREKQLDLYIYITITLRAINARDIIACERLILHYLVLHEFIMQRIMCIREKADMHFLCQLL